MAVIDLIVIAIAACPALSPCLPCSDTSAARVDVKTHAGANLCVVVAAHAGKG
jgi:hypothetical protein